MDQFTSTFDRHGKETPPSTKSSPGDSKRIFHSPRKFRTASFDASLLLENGTSVQAPYNHSHAHIHHSSHHSSAPLSSRYNTVSPQDPAHGSPFATFGMQKMSREGSDEEKQSLLSGVEGKTAKATSNDEKEAKSSILYYIVYALLNTTMSVPSLYGYASVIFNHDVFQPHIATLSKLVIWSSAVHQLAFVIFSSLSFAKAEVQDAGLLFLSCMTTFIAQSIVDEGGGIDVILSTTIVTLSIATASLGIVLMFLGKFNCANVVSYLPLPVVGGYLAFIGYFCVVAGIGLCISTSMIDGSFITDIGLLSDKHSFLLALPGLMAGLLMMIVARFVQSDAALPLTMVAIPASFYMVLYVFGYTMDDARQGQWVGEVQPTASITSLVDLVDFTLVRWDLVFSTRCLSVWVGMVFVVSFSSCLDVAAISMDM